MQIDKKSYQFYFKVSLVNVSIAPLQQSNRTTGLGGPPSMKSRNNNVDQLKLEIQESIKINFLI